MDRFDLYLHDYVTDCSYGTSATNVSRQLRDASNASVDVYINSRGGDVWEGMAIYNMLLRHRGRVVTHVDNAFSVASVIALAGDERLIGSGGSMMIHDGWYDGFGGGSDELRAAATVLDNVNTQMAQIYADRTGMTVEAARQAMKEETWYTSAQAVEAGLMDRIEGAASSRLAPSAALPSDTLLWTPDTLAKVQNNHTSFSLVSRGGFFALHTGATNTKPAPAAMSKPTWKDRILAAVGMSTDTPDEEVAEAVEKLASEKTEPNTTTTTTTASTPEAKTETPAPKAETPASQTDDLAKENAELKARLAAVEGSNAEAEVNAAIKDFKIEAKDRDFWKAEMKRDPARTKGVLAAIPVNATKPPGFVQERADGGGPLASSPVAITHEQSRNPKAYRTAKAQAQKLGVELKIVD